MKYKVLKEFLTIKNPRWLNPGEVIDGQPSGARIKALLEKGYIEEIPEEPKTVYDLKDGEECWMVGCCELGYTPVRLKFGKLAEVLRLTGSLYLTKGEAEKDIAWNMAQEILRRDTKGFKPKWSRSFADALAQNFTVVYDYHSGLLLPYMATTAHHAGDIYFATEDDARASIKAHPNEWKTYLGVGE